MQTNDTNNTKIALIANNVARVQSDIGEMKLDIKQIILEVQSQYVSKDEFEPVKRLVYGLVGLILVAVVGAILALVIVR